MNTIISKDGTPIAYSKVGGGDPVIIVDGALCYRAHWGQGLLAEILAPHLTVYTFDRRGRGDSGDTLPYSVDREIEDIDALIKEAGGTVYLYGVSSGSVLALKAAAQLGAEKIKKLALYEPPFNAADDQSKGEFSQYVQQVADLLKTGKKGDAAAFFLGDMLPPEMLDEMRQSPEWKLLEAVEPTLNYDNQVMGDGAVPVDAAQSLTMPVLVIAAKDSPAFKDEAAAELVKNIAHAKRKTLEQSPQGFDPTVAASALLDFFTKP